MQISNAVQKDQMKFMSGKVGVKNDQPDNDPNGVKAYENACAKYGIAVNAKVWAALVKGSLVVDLINIKIGEKGAMALAEALKVEAARSGG